jgi:hypothetical protein
VGEADTLSQHLQLLPEFELGYQQNLISCEEGSRLHFMDIPLDFLIKSSAFKDLKCSIVEWSS